MNTTISVNRSFFYYECMDSYPGIIIALSSLLLDIIFFLPLHFWILFMCFKQLTKGKGIPPTDIFTVVLSVMEIISSIGFFMCIISLVFEIAWTTYIAMFMLGKYIIGRPMMNCLICLERLIAVVYPVVFHRFSTLRLRCVCVAVAWLVTWSFGAYTIFTFPLIPLNVYSIFLTFSLLFITACSLGVLKALLKPSPGDKENEGMRNKRKRNFCAITHILVQLFLSYFLLLVTAFIKAFVPYDTFCLVTGISMWFLRPSSATQPILYLSKYNKLPYFKKHKQYSFKGKCM